MRFLLILVLGVAGALVAHQFSAGKGPTQDRNAMIIGAAVGVAVGIVLPLLLAVTAFIVSLIFWLAIVALVVLGAMLVWRRFR